MHMRAHAPTHTLAFPDFSFGTKLFVNIDWTFQEHCTVVHMNPISVYSVSLETDEHFGKSVYAFHLCSFTFAVPAKQ